MGKIQINFFEFPKNAALIWLKLLLNKVNMKY